MSTLRRYPFPYVANTLLAIVDGTVQPVTDVTPEDPAGGTYELPDDPDDADVRAYARISPDVVPAPPVEDPDDEDEPVLDDLEDDYEEDEGLADADDDQAEESDPDAPAYPDDPE